MLSATSAGRHVVYLLCCRTSSCGRSVLPLHWELLGVVPSECRVHQSELHYSSQSCWWLSGAQSLESDRIVIIIMLLFLIIIHYSLFFPDRITTKYVVIVFSGRRHNPAAQDGLSASNSAARVPWSTLGRHECRCDSDTTAAQTHPNIDKGHC